MLIVALTKVSHQNENMFRPKKPKSDTNEQKIEPTSNKQVDFDYLILRQIWPPSTCMFPETHTCSIAHNISTWVVHGLWYTIFYYLFIY